MAFLNEKGTNKLATSIRNLISTVSSLTNSVSTVQDTANSAKTKADDAIPKVTGATTGNVPVLDNNGQLTDGGVTLQSLIDSIAKAIVESNQYTDNKLANLLNSAPEELDTLGELATALAENDELMEVLQAAIGNKAEASALTSHVDNKENPHGVTKEHVGLGNVENKSSETIRGELTKANVTAALGYTPPEQDTVYTLPTASANTLGGIKVTVVEHGIRLTYDDGTE